MTFRFTRLLHQTLLSGAICCASGAIAYPAVAAPQVSVDFTVQEKLGSAPGTVAPGKLKSSDISGCLSGTVATIGAKASVDGDSSIFTGTKVITCGSGDTLTLTYRARTSRCAAADSGTWKVTGGTGIFATAKGQGQLTGRFRLGTGAGTFCKSDGIDDHYTGKLQL